MQNDSKEDILSNRIIDCWNYCRSMSLIHRHSTSLWNRLN